jgi:NTP pyrophosphatase (non-canonical NTP hydrolase)
MSERTSISVKALDALKEGIRYRHEEAERLRAELREVERQRKELWMLLDHIDTLDDACRDHDDVFRNFTRKHQRRRFEFWNPQSDAEVTSIQARIGNWVCAVLGPEAEQDAQERSLRTAEEVIELAQACGVPREALHRLVDYVLGRPVGDPAQEISGVLITLYSTANALGISADEALGAELLRIQRPEVMEKVRRRQAEKREALVGDLGGEYMPKNPLGGD